MVWKICLYFYCIFFTFKKNLLPLRSAFEEEPENTPSTLLEEHAKSEQYGTA